MKKIFQCSEDTNQNNTNKNHQLQSIALKELFWNVLTSILSLKSLLKYRTYFTEDKNIPLSSISLNMTKSLKGFLSLFSTRPERPHNKIRVVVNIHFVFNQNPKGSIHSIKMTFRVAGREKQKHTQ